MSVEDCSSLLYLVSDLLRVIPLVIDIGTKILVSCGLSQYGFVDVEMVALDFVFLMIINLVLSTLISSPYC